MNDFAGDGGNRAGRPTTSAGPGGGSTPPARSIPRFDAEARFHLLEDREKALIGEWAMALVMSLMARAALTMGTGRNAPPAFEPLHRAHGAAIALLMQGPGFETIADIALRRAPDPTAVTTLLGRVCRECGCTEFDACYPSCAWAEEPADGPGPSDQVRGRSGASLDGLCTTCAAGLEAEALADFELPCAVKLPTPGGGELTIRAGAKLSTLYEALKARDGQDLRFGGGA